MRPALSSTTPCLLRCLQRNPVRHEEENMDSSGDAALAAGGLGVFWLIYLVVIVLMIASMWKIFSKAGKPGWAAIIPIYNIIILMETVGRPGWWVILYLIPIVNLIIMIIVTIELSKSFGHEIGMALGLLFLPVIFYPWLAFGSSEYQGPAAA
jgi:hypothetical protein